MKMIWRMMWATDTGLKLMQERGEPFITNDYHDKILQQAVDQGKKDGHQASFREGVVYFANELQTVMQHWRDSETAKNVPIYELDQLLEKFGIERNNS